VAPGEYLICAVPDAIAVDWPDPSLLTQLQGRASALTVRAGQSITRDLVLQCRR
jgi:hypothetical protein